MDAPAGTTTLQAPRPIWLDRNAAIHLTVLSLSVCTAAATGLWFPVLLLPPAFLIATEVLYFGFGIPIYNHSNRVRRAYEWFDLYLDEAYGKGRDLTEAFFDGDRTKPYAQALTDKFDRFIELLELQPGDRLLDIGCGYGDFIAHARARGIIAEGITLSEHQAALCRERGLPVRIANVMQLPEDLYGRFDAVTFLGCIEHFGTYVTARDRKVHDRLLQGVFETAHRLLRPDSRVRRVLSSTIHEVKLDPEGMDWVHGYLIERHYSGLYPLGDDGLCKNAERWFDIVFRYDASDDYRLASEVDPLHFGNFRVRWTLKRILYVPLLFLLDPFATHKWLYHTLGSWMWQFGGVGGLPRDKRPVTLWWFVYQARSSGQIGAASRTTAEPATAEAH
jgi:SAM-dependent methyltransferase